MTAPPMICSFLFNKFDVFLTLSDFFAMRLPRFDLLDCSYNYKITQGSSYSCGDTKSRFARDLVFVPV